MSEDFLTRYQLDTLRNELAKIDLDLEMEAVIMLTEPARSNDQAARRPQPGSRPPYNIDLEHLLDRCRTALGAAIADISQFRGLQYRGGAVLTAQAKWVSIHRTSLAMITSDDREHTGVFHFEQLCKWCDRLDKAVRRPEPEYVIDTSRHQQALAAVVTADHFERMAHKLGDQAKGITARRIKYLRERRLLDGTKDPETGTWFYRIGDILAAQVRAKGA